MDRKISRILKKMSEDEEKNIKLVSSIPFSGETVKSVIYDEYDIIKKIDFLNILFNLYPHGAKEFCVITKHSSVKYIDIFLTTEILDNDKFNRYNVGMYKKLMNFAHELLTKNYDFLYEYFDGEDTLEIIRLITVKFLEIVPKIEMKEIAKEFLDFKKELYIVDFDRYFIDKNINMSIEELTKEITACFGDINAEIIAFRGTLLSKCTQHNPVMTSYRKNKVLMTKKLLEVGVDPNILNYEGESFIYDLLYMIDGNVEMLYDILKISLKHGFDLNSETELLRVLFQKFDITSELLNFLFDNGLKVSMEEVERIKSFECLSGNSEQLDELTISALANEEVDLFIDKLINNGYKIEDNFNKKIFVNRNDFNNILVRVKDIIGNYSTNCFSDLWFETIVENRNNSINKINDRVTVGEVLEGLRKLANDSVNILNNDIDNQKNKIMEYKK